MRILTLVLGALLLALAAAPAANALVRPEWVVVRWANADCKIWHNDTSSRQFLESIFSVVCFS
jgi:hypothetical protein